MIQQAKPKIGTGATYYEKSKGAPAPVKPSTARGHRRAKANASRKAA